MTKMSIAAAGAILFAATATGAISPRADDPAVANAIAAAVAHTSRPESDRVQDAQRKPGLLLAFAGVRPGLVVADFWPAGGYITRLLSRVVGSNGRVYAVAPKEVTDVAPPTAALVRSIDADPTTPNVSAYATPATSFMAPEALDLVWTTQNYHDFFPEGFEAIDSMAFNRPVFKSLKPGGIYLVSDHVAECGSGTRDSGRLHRIDRRFVMNEVLTAGFEFVEELPVLRNSNDNHSLSIFDDAIRGRTDQFVYRFRKPDRGLSENMCL